MVDLKATPMVPWPLKREAMIPAMKVACWSVPFGWLRPATMSVDSGEIAPARSGGLANTPLSITAMVIPWPVPPALKAALAWIDAKP